VDVTTQQYINSPKVTVSFEVSSDDWCLIQQSESWNEIERFVDRKERTLRKRKTDKTLQSIDSTLKRIETILCQKNLSPLKALEAAFVDQHHPTAPKIQVTIGAQQLFERKNEQKSQSH